MNCGLLFSVGLDRRRHTQNEHQMRILIHKMSVKTHLLCPDFSCKVTVFCAFVDNTQKMR